MDIHSKGFRLLIVDDNAKDRKKFVRLLRKNSTSDFRFLEAEDCASALDICRKFQPDCIITEYNLPDQTGIVFLNALKNDLKLSIPVIMVTDAGEEEVAVMAIKNGVQDYLPKATINHENLLIAIENAVERIAMQQQIERQQEEIIEKNRELTASNEALKNFAHTVAHDIRDPLGSMLTALEFVVSRNSEALGKHNVMLRECIKTLQRVLTLVSDILSFSKGMTETTDVETISLANVFEDVVSDLETLICENNAIITISSMPVIVSNRNNIYRIFLNLIKNALKYTQKNVRPEVNITCVDFDDLDHSGELKFRYKIIVKDNGMGFSEMYKESIFSPFKRLNTDDEIEGSGIGLASVKSILNHYKCDIDADGKTNEGAKFTISLPETILADNQTFEIDFQEVEKRVICVYHDKTDTNYAIFVTEENDGEICGYHRGLINIAQGDTLLNNARHLVITEVGKAHDGRLPLTAKQIEDA